MAHTCNPRYLGVFSMKPVDNSSNSLYLKIEAGNVVPWVSFPEPQTQPQPRPQNRFFICGTFTSKTCSHSAGKKHPGVLHQGCTSQQYLFTNFIFSSVLCNNGICFMFTGDTAEKLILWFFFFLSRISFVLLNFLHTIHSAHILCPSMWELLKHQVKKGPEQTPLD